MNKKTKTKKCSWHKMIQIAEVMAYTVQFNLLVMINYFGYESKTKLNAALA